MTRTGWQYVGMESNRTQRPYIEGVEQQPTHDEQMRNWYRSTAYATEAYTVTELDGEWYAVLDPIAAREAGHPWDVLSGYTSRRAAESAARLTLGLE